MALPVVPALSGCSVGTTNFDSQTNEIYNPAQGVNDRSGSVEVLNALIVSDQAGSGRLIAGLANTGSTDDALTGVEGTADGQTLTVTNSGGTTALAPNKLLQLADPDAATVLISGLEVKPGNFVSVTFHFQHADAVTLEVPVVEPGEDFAGVKVPSASPSSTTSGSPSGSASPSPSASSS
jgi:hypothetical protein